MFELIVLHDMYNKTRTIVVGFLGGEYSVKNVLPFKYKCFMDFFYISVIQKVSSI